MSRYRIDLVFCSEGIDDKRLSSTGAVGTGVDRLVLFLTIGHYIYSGIWARPAEIMHRPLICDRRLIEHSRENRHGV